MKVEILNDQLKELIKSNDIWFKIEGILFRSVIVKNGSSTGGNYYWNLQLQRFNNTNGWVLINEINVTTDGSYVTKEITQIFQETNPNLALKLMGFGLISF